jgi:hypothetical protein
VTTPRHYAIAAVAGVLAGAAIAASPGGIALMGVLGLLIWWAGRDLQGTERRWVTVWLVLAVAARLAAVVVLPLTVDAGEQSFATVAGGDASYMIRRSIWIRNVFVHEPFAARDFVEAFNPVYGWNGYTYVLAAVHVVFGPSPYAIQLLSTVLFVAAAVMVFRCARAGFGRAPAFIGLALVTSVPSLFLWSVAPLKEAPFHLLAVVVMCAAVALFRPRRWWYVPLAGALIGVAMTAIRMVRPEGAPMIAVALVAGVVAWASSRHRRIAVAAAALAASLTMVIAVGGWARGSAAASDVMREAFKRHFSSAAVPGRSFALLDADAYSPDTAPDTGRSAKARFLVRAAVRSVTVPEPWTLRPGVELLLIPQQMIWYALVVLCGIGVVVGLRRDPLLTSLLAAFGGIGVMAIGMHSGNIGTFIRHRDTIVPFAIWLSAAGFSRVLAVPRPRRINLLDAGMAAIPIVLVPVGFALYLLFRPPAIQLASASPQTVYSPGEMTLQGRHLRPFLRAYVSTGAPIKLNEMGTPFPQVGYLLRSGTEAILKIPALPPATYDLALFERGEEVAQLPRAFTVSRVAADPIGVVIVAGRFTAVDDTNARDLVAGATIAPDGGTPVAEILRVGPDRPQLESAGSGIYVSWVRMEGLRERPATLRIRCQFVTDFCSFAGQRVVADQDLRMPFPSATVRFKMDAVAPDSAQWPLIGGPTTDAVVDFIGWPGAQTLIAPGTRDLGGPTHRPIRPAEIVRIVAVEPFVGEAALDAAVPGERFLVEQPLVRIRAIVRFALLPSGEVDARSRAASVGSRIDFDTSESVLRGTIVSLAATRAPS